MKKTTAAFTTTLGLVLGSLHAQTVPLFINYQGTVTDSNGVGLGDTTPVNRKMIFRIYDSASGTNRLWSEQHTVTISKGQFSVLLGNGIDAVYNSVGETPAKTTTPLDTVFTSSGVARYVEIVVDNGNGTLDTADVAITPRQQITSTAYAFRARSADSVTAGSDLLLSGSANHGLGYYGSTKPFNGIAVDGPVLFGFGGGALGSSSGSTKNIALRWNAAGAVGIGSADLAGANSATKLVVQGDYTAAGTPTQVSVRGNTDTNKRLMLGYHTGSNYGSVQAFSAASTPSDLILNLEGGNVGIGKSPAGYKLHVEGQIYSAGTFNGQRIAANGTEGFSFNTNDADGGMFSPEDGVILFKTNGAERMRLFSSGSMAIGATTAATTLDVRAASPVITIGTSGGLLGGLYLGNENYGIKRNYGGVGNDVGVFTSSGSLFLSAAGNANTTGIVLTNPGNVGIGTSTPVDKLDVRGNIYGYSHRAEGYRGNSYGQGGYLEWNKTGSDGRTYLINNRGNGTGGIIFGEVGNTGTVTQNMLLTTEGRLGIGTTNPQAKLHVSGDVSVSDGRLGIGTTSPQAPLEVKSGVESTFYLDAYMDANGASPGPNANNTQIHSIIAEKRVQSIGFDVKSDKRIKNIVGTSNTSQDLATLMGIEVTDYTFKDSVSLGAVPQKKVIAQQVESVFPQAVGLSTNVIPDITRKATVKDGWVELATDLKAGERVRLVSKEKDEVLEVLEVASGRFRTALESTGEKTIFVYGREVRDFRSVDYDAIAMLNVSATQQLKKTSDAEISSLRAENAELRAKLAALETRETAMDAKIALIEKVLLETAKAPAAATVSVRNSGSAE